MSKTFRELILNERHKANTVRDINDNKALNNITFAYVEEKLVFDKKKTDIATKWILDGFEFREGSQLVPNSLKVNIESEHKMSFTFSVAYDKSIYEETEHSYRYENHRFESYMNMYIIPYPVSKLTNMTFETKRTKDTEDMFVFTFSGAYEKKKKK